MRGPSQRLLSQLVLLVLASRSHSAVELEFDNCEIANGVIGTIVQSIELVETATANHQHVRSTHLTIDFDKHYTKLDARIYAELEPASGKSLVYSGDFCKLPGVACPIGPGVVDISTIAPSFIPRDYKTWLNVTNHLGKKVFCVTGKVPKSAALDLPTTAEAKAYACSNQTEQDQEETTLLWTGHEGTPGVTTALHQLDGYPTLSSSEWQAMVGALLAPLRINGSAALFQQGCGSGALLSAAQQLYPGLTVQGMETSRGKVAQARKYLGEAVCQGTCLSCSVGHESQDHALSLANTLDIDQKQAAVEAVRDLAAITKPGGTIMWGYQVLNRMGVQCVECSDTAWQHTFWKSVAARLGLVLLDVQQVDALQSKAAVYMQKPVPVKYNHLSRLLRRAANVVKSTFIDAQKPMQAHHISHDTDMQCKTQTYNAIQYAQCNVTSTIENDAPEPLQAQDQQQIGSGLQQDQQGGGMGGAPSLDAGALKKIAQMAYYMGYRGKFGDGFQKGYAQGMKEGTVERGLREDKEEADKEVIS